MFHGLMNNPVLFIDMFCILALSRLKLTSIILKDSVLPRSKHSVSVIKINQLMLYREIIGVCSQIHTKHINTLCGQNVELYIYSVRTAQ